MKVRIALLLVLAIATLWLGWWTSRPPAPPDPAEVLPPKTAEIPRATPAPIAAREMSKPARAEDLLENAYEKLAQASPSDTGAFLEKLREVLVSYPRAEAVAAIGAFLGSKRDRVTNLPFLIGPAGRLASAPTLRVWLLDELGRVDLNAAAAQAESILASRGSADEWAIALRDYARARNTPEGAIFLRQKVREFWSEPRWQEEQSQGWLASFDLAVHLRAPEFTEDLTHMIRESRAQARPTAHAATTALDRLVVAEPVGVLGLLQKNPDWLRGNELERASYFSRANVTDPEQRSLVEGYLLDPSRDPSELEKFATHFPNTNRPSSENLITRAQPSTPAENSARERDAMRVLESWQADPRFEKLRPHLSAIQTRLAESARAAGSQ